VGAIGLYWWSPRRSATTLASEARHHARAWARLSLRGGHPMTNYGDELNRILVREVTGRAPEWRAIDKADLVAIGSVLVPYLQRSSEALVWGSGLSDPTGVTPLTTADQARFLAVRGPMTRDALGLPNTTPLGDPGLLAGQFLAPRKKNSTGTIVIPHFTVFNSRAGTRKLRSLQSMGYRIVLPTLSPQAVISAIAGADTIFSSGLHGVILAHSLGKGATLFRFDDSPKEVPFKYRDYFQSIGVTNARVHLWHELTDAATARELSEESRAEIEHSRPTIKVRSAEVLNSVASLRS